jgi:hypothetical protein
MMPKDSRGGVGATSLLGVGCIVGWLPIAQRAREASIVLVDVYCGASAGIVDTLIAAESDENNDSPHERTPRSELLRGDLAFCRSICY